MAMHQQLTSKGACEATVPRSSRAGDTTAGLGAAGRDITTFRAGPTTGIGHAAVQLLTTWQSPGSTVV